MWMRGRCTGERSGTWPGSGEGTQRTYAYQLADHLRWLAATGRREDTGGDADLKRYMALRGTRHAGPYGQPWRERPLGESALAVRAACMKGYYLHQTAADGVNPELRQALSASRLPSPADRHRSFLGHMARPVPANPLAPATPKASEDAAGRGRGGDARGGPHAPGPDDRDLAGQ